MKITDQNLGGAAAPETRRSQDAQPADRTGSGRTSSSAGDGQDRVEFSGGLDSLSRTLSSFHSDRAGRVQSLAAQYQSGNYHADSAAISHGMISEALGAGSH
jgi:anti-sigma28 factor (negative regulator of flagellin synthesis)